MSYSRWASGDVYTFPSTSGYFECCGCFLSPDGSSAVFETAAGLIAHLQEHRAAGHVVPEGTEEHIAADGPIEEPQLAAIRARKPFEEGVVPPGHWFTARRGPQPAPLTPAQEAAYQADLADAMRFVAGVLDELDGRGRPRRLSRRRKKLAKREAARG